MLEQQTVFLSSVLQMFFVYREVDITFGYMPHLISANKKREARDEKVKAAFDVSKQCDGARRIQAELASTRCNSLLGNFNLRQQADLYLLDNF